MSVKIEQFLFYFLFFAIPFQTRKILYSPGWYFNEWQSVSIYATDLILLALFVFWAVDNRHRPDGKAFEDPRQSRDKSVIHGCDYFLLGFLATAAISIKNSSDIYVGLFLWLKLVEFAAFYFYLKFYAVKKFSFIKIFYALILGASFQAVITIAQFLKQGDLGLRWFGESVLGPHMIGVASFFVASGEKVMRAYGMTPHPNVLAAYLFLSIFAFYFVVFYANHKHYDTSSYHSVYDSLIYHNIIKYWWAWYPLMLFGLFFTFSRTIVFLWAVGFLVLGVMGYLKAQFRHQFWDNEFLRAKIINVFLLTVIACAVFAVFYWPEIQNRMIISSEEEAVQLRIFYNKESLGSGINFFGIGLGDFTGWLMEQNPNLPSYMYQPVHNIYLLIYSEIGILGLIFFLIFLAGLIYEFIKKTKLQEFRHRSFFLVTVSILFIGLFDHFLFTIQQGRFVLWLELTLLTIGDIMGTQSRR